VNLAQDERERFKTESLHLRLKLQAGGNDSPNSTSSLSYDHAALAVSFYSYISIFVSPMNDNTAVN